LTQGIRVSIVLLGLVLSGLCCGAAFAGNGAATAKPPAKPKPVRAKPVPKPTFPARVRIAGVPLAGLDRYRATKAVRAAFARPLIVVVDGTRVIIDPRKFATAYVAPAIGRAQSAKPGDNVKLVVSVHGSPVRTYVEKLAERFARKGVPARLELRSGQPVITEDRAGRKLQTGHVVAAIVRALGTNTRLPVRFRTKEIPPAVTRSQIGPVILINRSLNRLTLFDRGQAHRFPIATGQAAYPTPSGRYQIAVKQVNPWWYPPTYSDWARGLSPVPPGPSNPLGTRWMGLTAPGVGIHATNNPSSIGYSVSHGCIRMQVTDAEWLYDHVGLGTTVFIV
jgi:lipoprotein-anchoring transpeptidase ErfK/SrfK